MKKSDPHRLYPFLMVGSLLLLVLFQVYWLTKVYLEQKEHLQRETENIFGNTIRDMQDSMMRRNIVVSPDSIKHGKKERFIRFNSNLATSNTTTVMIRMDSTLKPFQNDSLRRSRLQIIYRDHHPEGERRGRGGFRHSIEAALKRFPKGAPLFIQLSKDSLPLSKVRGKINAALQKNGLDLPFVLQRIDSIPAHFPENVIFNLAPANFPPSQFFYVEYPNFKGYLYQKMIPHLFFALFLLGLTTLSFFLAFRSLRQQQRLAKLKNDFISNITHELKTPIATVSVALEALNNFNALNNPERTREYLEISRHELNRLSILVDRVLKMSMFENQALELQKESFDFKTALENILNSLRLQFEKSETAVTMQVMGTDFNIHGDPIHLTNVVYNLIDNALKYSKENPKIDIALHAANGTLQLKVSDQGIGIASEYQSKIFEQFFRVPNENRHNIKGYGLGLSYVAGVVDLHGGKIDVESSLGKGTSFTISLPRDVGHHQNNAMA
jgi:two-component system phosphate regulon sensor histidine kinase PhoR